jgi:signal transduction histidine kinase
MRRRLALAPVWPRLDVALACLLAADFITEAATTSGLPSNGLLPTLLAAVPFAAPVAARRRWPLTALCSAIIVLLIQQALHGQLVTALPSQSAVLVPIFCAYAIGAWVEPRRGVPVLLVCFVLLYGVGAIATAQRASGAPGWVGSISLGFFFLIPAWTVGCLVRERTRRADAFAELERGALAERMQRERTAVAEEREMIGRELQDIIAHSVSVMVVQAGGARRLLGVEPDRARESILTVERTGREALAEMRRLLGVLRRDDDPRALTPQPGLAQLDELTAQMLGRGLVCEIEGVVPGTLTPGIDLVAYRVLEAALTQVAERGGRSARIRLESGPRALSLEVAADDMTVAGASALQGVADRVALYDGRLEVDDRGRKMRVRCELPLAGTGTWAVARTAIGSADEPVGPAGAVGALA